MPPTPLPLEVLAMTETPTTETDETEQTETETTVEEPFVEQPADPDELEDVEQDGDETNERLP